MSNIALKGDVIQNLGEYLPNPYIESVEITQAASSSVNVRIFYSLIFLISDSYDIDDIVLNLQNINIMFAFASSENPLKKQEFINAIVDEESGQGGTLREALRFSIFETDMDSIFDRIIDGDYIDDLYDDEGRRILKITATYNQTISTTPITNSHVHSYALTSVDTLTNLESSLKNIIYLNTSNITYEKIFSPGLNVLRQEEDIYLDNRGEKYGQTPILALNRNFYKTETITREDIISKVNSLVRRFEGRSIGPLTDSVNSIKAVLSKESETENLLVQLDKVRRSFPNKTNNNPVGNLYASFSKLLQNINSSFRPDEIVVKDRYLTGKVFDQRTGLTFGYDVPTPDNTIEYLPEEMFFVHRERLSEDETSDLAYNRGIFFIRYEELLKNNSSISKVINLEKFYEIASDQDFDNLRKILFSYLRIKNVFVRKSHKGLQVSTYNYSYGSSRMNRISDPVLYTFYNQAYQGALTNTEEFSERFREYNFGFDNPQERLLCYSFVDADTYSAIYEAQEIEQNGAMTFEYDIIANFQDDTPDFVVYLINKFNSINDLFQTYASFTNEICSYNNIDNRFNDFFVKSIREQFVGSVYPWELAPAIYSIMAYLLTDTFATFEDAIRYSKNISSTISPENGNLDSVTSFAASLDNLRTNQILEAAALNMQFVVRQRNIQLSIQKQVDLIPTEYQALLSEAEAEFESLFASAPINTSQPRVVTQDGVYYDAAQETSENPLGTELTSPFTGNNLTREVFFDYLMLQIDEAMSTYMSGVEFSLGVETYYFNFDTLDDFVEYVETLYASDSARREALYNGLGDALNYLIAGLHNTFRIDRDDALKSNGLGYPFDYVPDPATGGKVFTTPVAALVVDAFYNFVDVALAGAGITPSSLNTSVTHPSVERIVAAIRDYYRNTPELLMVSFGSFELGYASAQRNNPVNPIYLRAYGTNTYRLPMAPEYQGPDRDEILNIEDISL